jgi:hypothetical protein
LRGCDGKGGRHKKDREKKPLHGWSPKGEVERRSVTLAINQKLSTAKAAKIVKNKDLKDKSC